MGQSLSYKGEFTSYSVRFNSGEHQKIAFFAYDGGGEILLRNFRLFETAKAIIENPKDGCGYPDGRPGDRRAHRILCTRDGLYPAPQAAFPGNRIVL